jgi:hypothetical protein
MTGSSTLDTLTTNKKNPKQYYDKEEFINRNHGICDAPKK